jgi:hypothetical protein
VPEFPHRFGCIQDSRAFCQRFFQWYNQEHRHSGMGLLTPAMVHFGETQTVQPSVRWCLMPLTKRTRAASFGVHFGALQN